MTRRNGNGLGSRGFGSRRWRLGCSRLSRFGHRFGLAVRDGLSCWLATAKREPDRCSRHCQSERSGGKSGWILFNGRGRRSSRSGCALLLHAFRRGIEFGRLCERGIGSRETGRIWRWRRSASLLRRWPDRRARDTAGPVCCRIRNLRGLRRGNRSRRREGSGWTHRLLGRRARGLNLPAAKREIDVGDARQRSWRCCKRCRLLRVQRRSATERQRQQDRACHPGKAGPVVHCQSVLPMRRQAVAARTKV